MSRIGYWDQWLATPESAAAPCLTFEDAVNAQYVTPSGGTGGSEVVNYPAVVNAGDLLLAVVEYPAGSVSSDFTYLIDISVGVLTWVGYRIADGTEGGGTTTFTVAAFGPDPFGHYALAPLTIAIVRYSVGADGIYSVGIGGYDYQNGAVSLDPLDAGDGSPYWHPQNRQPHASYVLIGLKSPNFGAGSPGDNVSVLPDFSVSTPTPTTRVSGSVTGNDKDNAPQPNRVLDNSFKIADQLNLGEVHPTQHMTIAGFDPTQPFTAGKLIVVEVTCNNQPIPDAPVLSADCVDSSETDLSWTEVWASYYEVEWSPNGVDTWTPFSPIVFSEILTYDDTGLTGHLRYYRVRGVSNSGAGSYSNVVHCGTILNTPSIYCSPENAGIFIVWGTLPAVVDTVVVQRFNGATWDTIATPSSGILYHDTGLTNGTEYCYRVKFQGAGYTDSDYSNESCCTPVDICSFTPGALINDDFVDALVLSETSPDEFDFGDFNRPHTPVDGETLIGATKEIGEPNHMGNAGGNSIWFAFTPDTSGLWYFEFDTQMSGGVDAPTTLLLGIYTGASVASLTEVSYVSAPDDTGSYTDSCSLVNYTWAEANLDAGTTYYVAVDGKDGIEVDAIAGYIFIE